MTETCIDQLLDSPAFSREEADQSLFRQAFVYTADLHCKIRPGIQTFWQKNGLSPEDLKTEADLIRVPPVMVSIFKYRALYTRPLEEMALVLTSSGTGGQKSQIFLDQKSLKRVKWQAWQIHKDLQITSSRKYNYLCFTYDPSVAKDLGTAFTDELLTQFTKKAEVYYAIQWDEAKNDFALNIPGTIKTLQKFAKSRYSTRILGFPAFLYQILQDYGLELKLGEDSWVQTGGGWKNQADKQISKMEFRHFTSQRLGLPEANMRDMIGMVEHGVPYVDCSLGQNHIPNYARVFIRDPATLQILPEGQTGLIHLLCAYNTSYPNSSVLLTDYGRIGRCSCPLGGLTLEILGRAGISKHKGCAAKAAELLS